MSEERLKHEFMRHLSDTVYAELGCLESQIMSEVEIGLSSLVDIENGLYVIQSRVKRIRRIITDHINKADKSELGELSDGE